MRRASRFWVAASLLLASCGTAEEQQQTTTPAPVIAETKPPKPVTPPVTDLKGEILGHLRVGSLNELLAAGTSYVLPHLPPPLQTMVQPQTLKNELFKALRAEGLLASIDTKRPAVLAVADPKIYRQGVMGPALAVLPVFDPHVLTEFLGRSSDRHETTPWKDHIYSMGSETLMVRIDGAWAYLASNERLLNGAAGILKPLVTGPNAGSAELVLDGQILSQRYGADLEKAIDSLGAIANTGKGDLSSVITMLKRWLSYLTSLKTAALRLDLDPANIRFRLSAASMGAGALDTYLAKLNPGKPWGAGYLPADSVLIATSRRPLEMASAVEEAFNVAKVVLKDKVDPAMLGRWRDAVLAANKSFGDDAAHGLWVTSDGGIGLGGAFKIKGPESQRELAKLMRLLGKEGLGLINKVVANQLKKELPGLSFGLQVRPAGLRARGVPVDLYELTIRWPKLQDKAEKEQLEAVKKGLAKLLGPKVIFAFGAVNDVGLLTVGKDYRKRMEDMIAIAKGGPSTAMEKEVERLAENRQLTDLIHCPLASLAEGGLRVASQLTTIPNEVRQMLTQTLPGPGHNVPVSVLGYRDGNALVWDLNLSPDLLGVIAKLSMNIMSTRMGGAGMPPQRP